MFARFIGWYFHWTDRLGAAALCRMFPDDPDDFDELLEQFPNAQRAD